MAGDEKHARDSIADLDRWATALRMTGQVECSDALYRAIRVIEAALPGDGDWEYGVRYVENGLVHERFGLTDALDDCDDGTVLRRRPAGEWEPVEGVPRG